MQGYELRGRGLLLAFWLLLLFVAVAGFAALSIRCPLFRCRLYKFIALQGRPRPRWCLLSCSYPSRLRLVTAVELSVGPSSAGAGTGGGLPKAGRQHGAV